MKHLRRFQRHGDPLITFQPARDLSRAERFWSKVNRVEDPDECWEWIPKARHKFGYGIFMDRPYGTKKAHRVAWELTNGEIPNGLMVLHTCDNPPCCNPNHLFLGTAQDNSLDMMSKGRGRGQFSRV